MPFKQYTFRRWCFTYFMDPLESQAVRSIKNSVDPADPTTLAVANDQVYQMFASSMGWESGKVTYYVFQCESCPATGALHLQGYISFKDAITRTAVTKIMDLGKAHLEAAQADAETNFTYCTKKASRFMGYWCRGTIVKMGHRSDLDGLYELANQQATGKEMMQQFGGAGMRNLYLYQRTVRVIQDDDDADARIIAVRSKVIERAEQSAAAKLPRTAPSEDTSEEEDAEGSDDEAEDPFGV